MNRRVVITGVGIATAHGFGREAAWSGISTGTPAVGPLSAFDASCYRGPWGGEIKTLPEAGFSRLNKQRLDRASLLLHAVAAEALGHAGVADSLAERPVFLSLGTTLGGMLSGEAFHKEALAGGLERARLSLLRDYLAHSQALNLFSEYGLQGDFRVFSNACASGANAIGHACAALRSGDYEIALCGGYDTMSEFTFAGFNSLMAVSPSLSRPFDKNRSGLVLGEGAGVLVLEELEQALARGADILGEIAGYGESSDAYHMTSPEPSGKAAAAAMRQAWVEAGRPAVDYLNAHGTGTPYNDAMEAAAIALVFGEQAGQIPVSSIKPMIGHLLGGAGTVEAIVSLLSIRHGTLPPNINYETPDPACPLKIVTTPVQTEVRTVMSNSFGFGGSNASLVIRSYP